MQLLALGVGDAFTRKRFTSCLALRAEGRWLVVDCSHPFRRVLHESSVPAGFDLDIDQLDGVLLTHLHSDHASGLEAYGFWSFFVLGRRAKLLAHPMVTERLWEMKLRSSMENTLDVEGIDVFKGGFDSFFEHLPLDLDAPVQFGPFSIECRRAAHPIPTTALRISAGGRTLGISSDTAYDPELITWLEQSDLYLHDVGQGIHAPYEKLVGVESKDRMRLVYYSDSFDLEASEIEPLIQGRLYEV